MTPIAIQIAQNALWDAYAEYKCLPNVTDDDLNWHIIKRPWLVCPTCVPDLEVRRLLKAARFWRNAKLISDLEVACAARKIRV